MTSEERMAYYMNQRSGKREKISYKQTNTGAKRIRISLTLLLMIVFLSLDYSGCKIGGIGSEEIIQFVITDFSFENLREFDFSLLGN
jgi:hypothetical protein